MRITYAATVAIALFGCGYPDEEVASRHATAAAAQSTVEAGWIPEILPPSATNIIEEHDLDTNITFGSFSFEKADASGLQARLQPLSWAQAKRLWRAERAKGYALYRVPYDGRHTVFNTWIIAVDWQRNHVLFWNDNL